MQFTHWHCWILLPGEEDSVHPGVFKPGVSGGFSKQMLIFCAGQGPERSLLTWTQLWASPVFPCSVSSNIFSQLERCLKGGGCAVSLYKSQAARGPLATCTSSVWPRTIRDGTLGRAQTGLCHGAVPCPASKHHAHGIASHGVCAWGTPHRA